MTEYRYTLTRDVEQGMRFDDTGRPFLAGRLCWVMLNPSTADDTTDDPTIRRVMRFTRDAGYAELEVVNLFAARATNPRRLFEHDEPTGADNPAAQRAAFRLASRVVAAWGASGGSLARAAGEWVRWRAADYGHSRLLCLGVTADGSPRHPLYVKASQPLVEYPL